MLTFAGLLSHPRLMGLANWLIWFYALVPGREMSTLSDSGQKFASHVQRWTTKCME